MPNGSSRVLPVILSLVVGAVVGWLVGCAQPAPVPQPTPAPTVRPPTPIPTLRVGHHTIVVGPNATDLSDDPAEMSQSQHHRARWIAQDPTQTLTIHFKKADFDPAAGGEPPFAGPPGVDLNIPQNSKGVCDPGPINTRLHPTGQLKYKYSQTLVDAVGKRIVADGMIIIDP